MINPSDQSESKKVLYTIRDSRLLLFTQNVEGDFIIIDSKGNIMKFEIVHEKFVHVCNMYANDEDLEFIKNNFGNY